MFLFPAIVVAGAACAPPARDPGSGSRADGGGSGGNQGSGGSGAGGASGGAGGSSGSGGRAGAGGGGSSGTGGGSGTGGSGTGGISGTGGGGSSGTGGGSGGPDAGRDSFTLSEGGMTCGQQQTDIPYSPSTPDVLIVFDHSGSMDFVFGGGKTRYQAERDILKPLVAMHANRVRWGFERFPIRENCESTTGCCAEQVCIPPALDNTAKVHAGIDDMHPFCPQLPEPPPNPPCGGGSGQNGCPSSGTGTGATPSNAALRAANEFYAGFIDGIVDRYVLLSTDGDPSCKVGVDLCQESVDQIKRLLNQGVKTIVLGLSPDVANSACLQRMGAAGGGPRANGNPSFYPARDPAALNTFLQEIVSGIAKPPCHINLNAMPIDRDRVAVFFDGKQIPRDPGRSNGWEYDASDPKKILLYGSYCANVESFMVSTVDVKFGCPPCGGTVSCD